MTEPGERASAGASALEGAWVVESIDGVATARAVPTIEFAAGHVHGTGSVNRYRGAYELVDGRLVVGPVMSTMMAGPAPAMAQEQRWFRALSSPAEVRVVGATAIELGHDDGTVSLLRSATVTVRGTVTYRARIAMPPGAVVTVWLDDDARADVAAEPVASTVIVDPGNVPVAFELAVATGAGAPPARLALRAWIDVGGELWFISEGDHPVDLHDPTPHELLLRRVGS